MMVNLSTCTENTVRRLADTTTRASFRKINKTYLIREGYCTITVNRFPAYQ
jgi:hypothetical protein